MDTTGYLQAWVEALGAKARRVAIYRDYYDGRHRLLLDISSEQYRRYFAHLIEHVRENLCKPVVRCFAERLSIERWSGEDAERFDPGRYDIARIANRVHTEALKVGEAFLLVWPDATGEDRLWVQRAEDMLVIHDPERPGRIAAAVKAWQAAEALRVNIYDDRRVARYIRGKDAKTFEPFDGDGAPAEIPHAYGAVPVVRFAHDADTEDGPGRSVLEDVIPLQDLLNKELADLLVASEFFALPMRVFTGVRMTRDLETGTTIAEEFNPRRDRTLFFGNEDVKVTQLAGADLRPLLEVTDGIALKVARVTGVPVHYLTLGTGSFPSGEALRTAEARLVAKVDDLHDEWTGAWRAAARLLGYDIEPVWMDADRLTESERLERLRARKDLGLPWARVMREMGFSADEIETLRAERDAERLSASEAYARAFDAAD